MMRQNAAKPSLALFSARSCAQHPRFAPLSKDQIKSRLLEVSTAENVKTTEDGVNAILDLSNGDMRRVMNLLQSTSMAYDIVSEENVYLTSASPLPDDMTKIFNCLLNETFKVSYDTVKKMCQEKGYALADVVTDLTALVLATEMPDEVLGEILDGMSGVEHQLAFGTDESLQLAALIGIFIKGRTMMTPA